MSDASSGHGEGLELPTGDELRAAREARRRARIKIAIQAKHDGNPLYRERVRNALSKHWDGNGKRLTDVWALRDRVRELERVLADLRGLKTDHWVSDCGSTSAESALDEVARRVDAVLAPNPPGHAQGESAARVRWIDD